MPTDHPRVQVTLDEQTNQLLSEMALSKNKSKSSVAADLIRYAMEMDEDYHLSKLAESRDTKDTIWVKDHDAIWD